MEIIADTYLSVNTPAQNALTEWLSLQPQINEVILDRLRKNRCFLSEKLKNCSFFELLSAEGGWYSILKIPAEINEEELVLELLKEEKVFVHPGYFFDLDAGTHIVLSLLTPVSVFQEGFLRIFDRLKKQL